MSASWSGSRQLRCYLIGIALWGPDLGRLLGWDRLRNRDHRLLLRWIFGGWIFGGWIFGGWVFSRGFFGGRIFRRNRAICCLIGVHFPGVVLLIERSVPYPLVQVAMPLVFDCLNNALFSYKLRVTVAIYFFPFTSFNERIWLALQPFLFR